MSVRVCAREWHQWWVVQGTHGCIGLQRQGKRRTDQDAGASWNVQLTVPSFSPYCSIRRGAFVNHSLARPAASEARQRRRDLAMRGRGEGGRPRFLCADADIAGRFQGRPRAPPASLSLPPPSRRRHATAMTAAAHSMHHQLLIECSNLLEPPLLSICAALEARHERARQQESARQGIVAHLAEQRTIEAQARHREKLEAAAAVRERQEKEYEAAQIRAWREVRMGVR